MLGQLVFSLKKSTDKPISCCPCRLLLLMGGFLLFFIAFFTVHAVFKVRLFCLPSLLLLSAVGKQRATHPCIWACMSAT